MCLKDWENFISALAKLLYLALPCSCLAMFCKLLFRDLYGIRVKREDRSKRHRHGCEWMLPRPKLPPLPKCSPAPRHMSSRHDELSVVGEGVRANESHDTASVMLFFFPSAEEKLPALTFGTTAKFGNENSAATTDDPPLPPSLPLSFRNWSRGRRR